MDIKRAVYIELPEEDPMSESGEYVGLLLKAMYGLREAPQIWAEEVENTLKELGYRVLVGTPCVYINDVDGTHVLVHVDDFMCLGSEGALKRLEAGIKKRFEVKVKILGPDPQDLKEGTFLGRKIKWTKDGIEYSGDEQLITKMIEEWKLEKVRWQAHREQR